MAGLQKGTRISPELPPLDKGVASATWPAPVQHTGLARSASAAGAVSRRKATTSDAGFDDFLSRQVTCTQFVQKWVTMKRMREIEEQRKKITARKFGAQGLDGFKAMLMHRYGSIVRAWRFGLDLDGSGKLSFMEFSAACRAIGFSGSVMKVWKEMDSDGSGYVSLNELAPDAHNAMSEFREKVVAKYGNMLAGWKQSMDRSGQQRCTLRDFEKCCVDVGCRSNARQLFDFFCPEKGKQWLQMEDIDPAMAAALWRGDESMVTVLPVLGAKAKSELSFFERQECALDTRAQCVVAREHRVRIEKMANAVKGKDVGPRTLEEFRTALIHRYGNLVQAWRIALDPDDNGRVSFQEFTAACRGMHYSGNIKKLWAELDKDRSGLITMSEFAPAAQAAMSRFRALLIERFGNPLKAWLQAFRDDGHARVREDEFVKKVADLGWEGNSSQLFHWYLPAGAKYISLSDIDAKAAEALSRGDLEMVSVGFRVTKPSVDMPFEQRQMTFSQGWRSAQIIDQRGKMQTLEESNRMADKGAKTCAQFKLLLQGKYGNLVNAWRKGLDISGDGKLSFAEFNAAARALGFSGSVRKLWAELDSDQSGVVTLGEFAPDAHRSIEEFLGVLRECHGNTLKGWVEGLDKDKNGMLSEMEFEDRCKELGISSDAKRLYKWLCSPGSKGIVLADVDPKAAQALARGDHDMLLSLPGIIPKCQMTFFERQQLHGRQRWEKIFQRDREGEQQERQLLLQKDMSAKNLASFKKLLVHRCGSLAKAWRQVLDCSGDGKVSHSEFTVACRAVGYSGDVAKLWRELDLDGSGIISLSELDKSAGLLVRRFYDGVANKYGDATKLFLVHCRLNEVQLASKASAPDGGLHLKKFESVCVELGIIGKQVDVLFGWLKKDDDRTYLLLSDIDPKAAGALKQQELQHREAVAASREAQKRQEQGARTLQQFKSLLRNKFGTLAYAWRKGLDISGDGKLSFSEFASACRAVGFAGQIKAVWNELDTDQMGSVTLAQFDRCAHNAIATFKELLIKKHENCLKGWLAELDQDKTQRCTSEELKSACVKLGYSGSADKLFEYLVVPGSRHLTLADIDLRAQEALARGDLDMMTVERRGARTSTVARQWLEQQNAADLEALRQAQHEHDKADRQASTLPALLQLMSQRFGNVVQAWKRGFDVDGSGSMSFSEFSKACRSLGFTKNIRRLWDQLDSDRSGTVSLREFAAEAHRDISEMQELLEQKFGNLLNAWFRGLDLNGNRSVDESEFLRCMRDVQFSGDAKRLFKWLLPLGRRALTIEDLDPKAASAMARGDWAMVGGRTPAAKSNGKELARAMAQSSIRMSDWQLDRFQSEADVLNYIQGKSDALIDVTEVDIARLRTLLVDMFGSLEQAWYLGFRRAFQPGDHDHGMKESEFLLAMRGFGFCGSVGHLFRQCSTDGCVTLESLVGAVKE